MQRVNRAVGATLTACGLILGAPSLLASAATPQTTQSNSALRYIYSQVGTDGSVAGTVGATEDAIISVADNGYDPATLRSPASGTSAYSYLSAKASTITTAGGAAKYILAWLAADKPAAIDASALLTKLNAPAPGGFLDSNGAFHNANAMVEMANAYSQSLAVLADVGAGQSLPPDAIGWLTCAQRSDGGFGYTIDDSTSTPPAFCGDTASDTNDTGIVLQALGQAQVHTADSAAETYLHSVQKSDAGFGFNAMPGSDPDSDAIVIQALVAIGQDPTGSAWRIGTASPLSNMESFADPQGSGGYVYPGNSAPDAFTTSAVPQALALKPYAAATTVVAGSSPPAAPAATPTPSPTSSVKAVTVPATGAGGAAGGPTASLVLVAAGLLVLACTWLRGRRSPAP